MFRRALKLAALPIGIAMLVTPVRFFLELAGLPEVVIFPIGLLWLTLVFAVVWGRRLADDPHGFRLLLLALALYSPPSRVPVFVLWWITKTWELGTHYDIFDDWVQALVGQLFWGSLVQIVPGAIVGAVTLAVVRRRRAASGADTRAS